MGACAVSHLRSTAQQSNSASSEVVPHGRQTKMVARRRRFSERSTLYSASLCRGTRGLCVRSLSSAKRITHGQLSQGRLGLFPGGPERRCSRWTVEQILLLAGRRVPLRSGRRRQGCPAPCTSLRVVSADPMVPIKALRELRVWQDVVSIGNAGGEPEPVRGRSPTTAGFSVCRWLADSLLRADTPHPRLLGFLKGRSLQRTIITQLLGTAILLPFCKNGLWVRPS